MKIFVGVVEVAGYYGNLAKGLRNKGLEVSEFYLSEHVFAYGSRKEPAPLIFKIYRKFRLLRTGGNLNLLSKLFVYPIEILLSRAFLYWAALKFDVFVFGYGTSILNNNQDLVILKKRKKKVISVIIHGSESRPPYINGAKRLPDGSFLPGADLMQMAALMKNQMEVIEHNSDFVIAAPFSCHYLKKPFINHFYIGLPYQLPTEPVPLEKAQAENSIRILHSPSKPLAKGTYEIRKVITSLKNRGYAIEFVEVVNQPNSVVIMELQKCDFIIDQLYSDTPLAGFATEAAFYGKAAVVGGYGWDQLKSLIPKNLFPPSEICHPEELELAIVKLIENRDYRNILGLKAREFVSKNWDATIVAKKYFEIISGHTETDWLLNPNKINYLNGVGISEADAKKLIRKVLNHGGEKALFLDEKKALKKAFLEFANDTGGST